MGDSYTKQHAIFTYKHSLRDSRKNWKEAPADYTDEIVGRAGTWRTQKSEYLWDWNEQHVVFCTLAASPSSPESSQPSLKKLKLHKTNDRHQATTRAVTVKNVNKIILKNSETKMKH